jgi:hypothetical protein
VQKYACQFDQHKSTNKGPVYITLDRKKAFINQSEGRTNFHRKKYSLSECEQMLNSRIHRNGLLETTPVLSVSSNKTQINIGGESTTTQEEFIRSNNFEDSLPFAY